MNFWNYLSGSRGAKVRVMALFGVLSVLLNSTSAQAWSSLGHGTIGYIAEHEVSPKTLQEVERLLRLPLPFPGSVGASAATHTLVSASAWADIIRDAVAVQKLGPPLAWDGIDEYGHDCHFFDLHVPSDRIDFFNEDSKIYLRNLTLARHSTEKNILSCISRTMRVLKSPGSSDYSRAYVLRYLIHLIGDLHQPLHVFSLYDPYNKSDTGNRGGSTFEFKSFNFKALNGKNGIHITNLHTLWDTGFGAYLQFKPRSFDANSERQYISKIVREMKSYAYIASIVNRSRIETEPSVEKWALESVELGLNVAYQGLSDPFSAGYISTGKQVVHQQQFLAGHRLAYLLNALFDPSNAREDYIQMVENFSL